MLTCSMCAGGYTRTNPELRRVKPEAVQGRVCVKIVYVVLEAQYQSSLTAAVKRANATNDKVCCASGVAEQLMRTAFVLQAAWRWHMRQALQLPA